MLSISSVSRVALLACGARKMRRCPEPRLRLLARQPAEGGTAGAEQRRLAPRPPAARLPPCPSPACCPSPPPPPVWQEPARPLVSLCLLPARPMPIAPACPSLPACPVLCPGLLPLPALPRVPLLPPCTWLTARLPPARLPVLITTWHCKNLTGTTRASPGCLSLPHAGPSGRAVAVGLRIISPMAFPLVILYHIYS